MSIPCARRGIQAVDIGGERAVHDGISYAFRIVGDRIRAALETRVDVSVRAVLQKNVAVVCRSPGGSLGNILLEKRPPEGNEKVLTSVNTIIILDHDEARIARIFPDIVRTVGDILQSNSRKHRSSGITGHWRRTWGRSRKTYWAGRDVEVSQFGHRDRGMNIADHTVNAVARLLVCDVHRRILAEQKQARLEDSEEHQAQQDEYCSRDHHFSDGVTAGGRV